MLICPVCGRVLFLEEKRAFCEAGHSFDRAKEGYFNLLMSSSTGAHGDDRAMLLARRCFLEKGYYAHLLEALKKSLTDALPEGGVVMDAGCGEGYYTYALREAFSEKGIPVSFFAFDVAKEAARLVAKKMGNESTVFVGSSYRIPMADGSVDGIVSLFAPFSREEFLRVLRPSGVLIRAYPLEEHLFALKKAVYERPLKNEAVTEETEPWQSVTQMRVGKEITLQTGEDVRALFGMTPYAHKTSRRDMEKLEAIQSLAVQTDFGISLYRKKA